MVLGPPCLVYPSPVVVPLADLTVQIKTKGERTSHYHTGPVRIHTMLWCRGNRGESYSCFNPGMSRLYSPRFQLQHRIPTYTYLVIIKTNQLAHSGAIRYHFVRKRKNVSAVHFDVQAALKFPDLKFPDIVACRKVPTSNIAP